MVSLPFSTWGFGEITGTSDSSILRREREIFSGALMHFLKAVFGVPSHPLFSNVALQTAESQPFPARHRTAPNNNDLKCRTRAPRLKRRPLMFRQRGFICSKSSLTTLVFLQESADIESSNVL